MQAARNPERWSTQVRKGVLELAILNVIASEQPYGYEIAKKLAVLPGLEVREGTVYPILSRLRGDGLVSTTLEESSEGPTRKHYRLTSAGRRQLDAMNRAWDQLQESLETLRRR